MRHSLLASTIGLALAGCGLPPIIEGARFLVLNESGIDTAQLDFPDQRGCEAARRAATAGTARCQRTTLWDALPVSADADLPDRIRIGAHFRSMALCERPSSLSIVGASVFGPCVPAAPRRFPN